MTVRVVMIGAAYSANKGAASMIQALVDQLPARCDDVAFDVLTTYPAPDAAALDRAGSPARAVSCRPVELVTVLVPLALLTGALRRLRLPSRWACRAPALDAINRADVVVDVSGISYSDARRLPFTIYAFLLNLLPLLLGTPQVKAAQALGPFGSPVNRALARVVLPALESVTARGGTSSRHLDDLGVDHIVADDLAFLMQVPGSARSRAAEVLGEGTGPWIGIAPSAVVDGFCRRQGIDYVGAVARFVDAVTREGTTRVVLVAHSTSTAELPARLDDRPVCRAVAKHLVHPERCRFVDEDLLPTELRALIERCTVLVTSRFHAMVSALAVGTPVVVVGWSHKYGEVLRRFGQDDVMIDYADLSSDAIGARVERVLAEHGPRETQIHEGLGAVVASAERNLDEITRVVDARSGSGHR